MSRNKHAHQQQLTHHHPQNQPHRDQLFFQRQQQQTQQLLHSRHVHHLRHDLLHLQHAGAAADRPHQRPTEPVPRSALPAAAAAAGADPAALRRHASAHSGPAALAGGGGGGGATDSPVPHRRAKTTGSAASSATTSSTTRSSAVSFLSTINLALPPGEDPLQQQQQQQQGALNQASPASPEAPERSTAKVAQVRRKTASSASGRASAPDSKKSPKQIVALAPAVDTLDDPSAGKSAADSGGAGTWPSPRTAGSGAVITKGRYSTSPEGSSALTRAFRKEKTLELDLELDPERTSEVAAASKPSGSQVDDGPHGRSSASEDSSGADKSEGEGGQYVTSRRLTQSPSPYRARRGKHRPGGSPLSGRFDLLPSAEQEGQGGPSKPSPANSPGVAARSSAGRIRNPFAPLLVGAEHPAVAGKVWSSSSDDPQSAAVCSSAGGHGTCVSLPGSRRGSAFSRKGSVREVSATTFLSSIALISPTNELDVTKGASGTSDSKEPTEDLAVQAKEPGDAAAPQVDRSGRRASQEGINPMDTPIPEDSSGAKVASRTSLASKLVRKKSTGESVSKEPPDSGDSAAEAHVVDRKGRPLADVDMNASGRRPQRRKTIGGLAPHEVTATFSEAAADLRRQRMQQPASAGESLVYRTLSGGSLAGAFSEHRVYFATQSGVPFAAYCLIRHNDKKMSERRAKRLYLSNQYIEKIAINGMDALKKKKAESYAHFVIQSNCLGAEQPEAGTYNPYYLDDPELRTGKHRTVISLPCFMGSIIQYTRPADLKKELNDHFRASHPNIDPSLMLSQIRRIKSKLIAIGEEMDLEISSVAKSFAYFEKLVLKNLVNKANRKLIAGVCLLLATKVNERKGFKFSSVVDCIAKNLELTPKDIRNHEFSVFAALEFTLYIQRHEFMPHFERIFSTMAYNNVSEYLGDNQFYLGTN